MTTFQDPNNNNPMIDSASSESPWNLYEEKMFEHALVLLPENTPDRWQKIAHRVTGGKIPEDVRDHYDVLVRDLLEIELGRVKLPCYSDDYSDEEDEPELRVNEVLFGLTKAKQDAFELRVDEGLFGLKKAKHEVERKKGIPWTEAEHRFLAGLELFGKGDWRNISRRVVKTRTATEVASHAQKFFLRQNSLKKERKRSSIHDITTISDTMQVPTPCNFSAHEWPFHMGYQSYGFPKCEGERYMHCN